MTLPSADLFIPLVLPCYVKNDYYYKKVYCIEKKHFSCYFAECLQASGVVVLRAFCGTFMTSLEMAGVSITCFKCEVDSPILEYLGRCYEN